MKKTVYLFTLLVITFFNAVAQDEVLFQAKFIPNSTYSSVMSTTSTSTVNFDADEAFISQMEANGMTLPMIVKGEQKISTTTTTGSKNAADEFPILTSFDEIVAKQTMNGNEQPSMPNPIEGAKTYGRVTADGKMKIDSISGDQVNEQLKAMIKQMTETMLENIEFPDEPMKIGEDFTQEVPLSIPMAGMQPIQVLIVTNYKLTNIENGTAYFDVKQNVQLDGDIEQANMKADGGGTGKSTYDIKHSMVTSSNVDLTMNLSIASQQFTVNAEVKSKTSQNVSIKSNN